MAKIEKKNGDTEFTGSSFTDCAKQATAYLLKMYWVEKLKN